MMTRAVFSGVVASAILVSSPGLAQGPQSEAANLKKKLAALEEKVSLLQRRVFALAKNDTIWINPTSPDKYQRVDSTLGFFLVSLERVEPYLDGQRVYLTIGNPSSITFEGFSLDVEWGKRVPEDTNQWAQWSEALRHKELSFTNTLLPGTWTRVDFVLAPAPTGEFGHLALSMQTDVISLRRPSQ